MHLSFVVCTFILLGIVLLSLVLFFLLERALRCCCRFLLRSDLFSVAGQCCHFLCSIVCVFSFVYVLICFLVYGWVGERLGFCCCRCYFVLRVVQHCNFAVVYCFCLAGSLFVNCVFVYGVALQFCLLTCFRWCLVYVTSQGRTSLF